MRERRMESEKEARTSTLTQHLLSSAYSRARVRVVCLSVRCACRAVTKKCTPFALSIEKWLTLFSLFRKERKNTAYCWCPVTDTLSLFLCSLSFISVCAWLRAPSFSLFCCGYIYLCVRCFYFHMCVCARACVSFHAYFRMWLCMCVRFARVFLLCGERSSVTLPALHNRFPPRAKDVHTQVRSFPLSVCVVVSLQKETTTYTHLKCYICF